jgi:hypothetical protein
MTIQNITIENPKIASVRLAAQWWDQWTPADFAGISYLFDNPAKSLAEENGLPFIACDTRDPNRYLDLYAGLARAVELLEPELRPHNLMPLSPSSYHCTCWDGVNQSNIDQIREPERSRYEAFFKGLPESTAGPLPPNFPPRVMRLPGPWSIRFRFKELHIWTGAAALVALLEPADAESEASTELIKQHRRDLDEQFAVLGKPPNRGWSAHISLGYFQTAADAEAAKQFLEQWTAAARQEVGDHTVRYSSASIYAFTNMEKFWLCRFPAVIISLREIQNALKADSSNGERKSSSRTSIRKPSGSGKPNGLRSRRTARGFTALRGTLTSPSSTSGRDRIGTTTSRRLKSIGSLRALLRFGLGLADWNTVSRLGT